MTEVDDLSRFDSSNPSDVAAVDSSPGGVILNIEDPGCSNKAHRAHDLGIPWALYSWLYQGQGANSVTRLQAMVDLLVLDGLPTPPKGGFIDFEANGVSTADAAAARAAKASVATPIGFYTYLYLLNWLDGLHDEWNQWDGRWVAYYPGNNDGSFPGYAMGDAAAVGAMLWQYTSSGGSRDRSVIVNEAAWAAWGTVSAPSTPTEDDSVGYISKKSDPNVGIWGTNNQTRRWVSPDEWALVVFFSNGNPPGVLPLTDSHWGTIPDIQTLVDRATGPAPVVDPTKVKAATIAAVEAAADGIGTAAATAVS